MFSNKRPATFAFASVVALSAVVTGCAKTNPAVGTWSGKTPMGSSATLTLAADGTGTVSLPPIMQNKPVQWKDGENKKIELSIAPAAGGTAPSPLPAFVGDDQKTLTVAFPAFSLTLNKADAAK